MKYRVIVRATPGHVHCRVFVVTADDDPLYECSACGSLTVRQGVEFAALVEAFSGAEFVAEDPGMGIDKVSGGIK